MSHHRPRYALIGYPSEHETILAKSLLRNARIKYIFIYITEDDMERYGAGSIKKFPAIRLISNIKAPLADGLDEIKGWLLAS